MKPRALFVVFPALVLAVAVPAAAAPPDEGRKEFEAGLQLYRAHDYSQALRHFQASYALGRRAAALRNVAQCHRELKHLPEAYEAYARLLREHGPQLDPAERDAVTEALADLATVTGAVQVDGEPGAAVTIDGAPAGTLPLDAGRRVTVGTHAVEVATGSGVPFRTEVTVGAGKDVRVVAPRRSAGAVAPPSAPPSAPAPRPSPPPSSPVGSAAFAATGADTAEQPAPAARPESRSQLGGLFFVPVNVGHVPHAIAAVDQGTPVAFGGAARFDYAAHPLLSVEALGAAYYSSHEDRGAPSGNYSYESAGGFLGAGVRMTSRPSTIRFTGATNLGYSVRQYRVQRLGAPKFDGADGYGSAGMWLDAGVLIRLSRGVSLSTGLVAWIDFPDDLRIEPPALARGEVADRTGNTYVMTDGVQASIGPSIGLHFGL